MSYNSPFSGAEVDDAVTKRHEKNKDTKLDEGGANETTAQETREHIDATDNPHGVSKTQVGLGDVDNVSAADLRDRSTHTGTQPLSTISDAGTIASQDANSVNIDGGTIDGTAVNATTLTASGDVNFDSGTLFVDVSENKVGIGTTSPSLSLDVIGGNNVARFTRSGVGSSAQAGGIALGTDFGTAGVFIAGSESGNTIFGQATDISSPSFGTATERMRIDSSGNVGIGTTSPAEKLHVAGDITYGRFVLPNWNIRAGGKTPNAAQVNHANALFGLASQRGAGWSRSGIASNGLRYSFLKTSDNSYIGWTFLFEDPSNLVALVRYNRQSGSDPYKVILEYSLDNEDTWQVLEESASITGGTSLSGSIPAETEGASIVSVRTRYSEGTVFTNNFNGLSGFNISGKAKSWQIVGSILGA